MSLSIAGLGLGLSMPPSHYLCHVFCAGLAVHRQSLFLTPRHERLDLDVHLFDSLSFAFDRLQSLKSTLLPLFVRVVELLSVFNDFRQTLPLPSVKPCEPNHHSTIGRVLGHNRVYRGLVCSVTGPSKLGLRGASATAG